VEVKQRSISMCLTTTMSLVKVMGSEIARPAAGWASPTVYTDMGKAEEPRKTSQPLESLCH
jgi:hypothetical protein